MTLFTRVGPPLPDLSAIEEAVREVEAIGPVPVSISVGPADSARIVSMLPRVEGPPRPGIEFLEEDIIPAQHALIRFSDSSAELWCLRKPSRLVRRMGATRRK